MRIDEKSPLQNKITLMVIGFMTKEIGPLPRAKDSAKVVLVKHCSSCTVWAIITMFFVNFKFEKYLAANLIPSPFQCSILNISSKSWVKNWKNYVLSYTSCALLDVGEFFHPLYISLIDLTTLQGLKKSPDFNGKKNFLKNNKC